jgi:hypothetical protein
VAENAHIPAAQLKPISTDKPAACCLLPAACCLLPAACFVSSNIRTF